MTQLLAVPTYNVSEPTAARPTTPVSQNVSLGTLSSHMPRNIAEVAYRIIATIACQVTCFPTVVASLVICAVSSNMALLVAVIAQPQVPGGNWGS